MEAAPGLGERLELDRRTSHDSVRHVANGILHGILAAKHAGSGQVDRRLVRGLQPVFPEGQTVSRELIHYVLLLKTSHYCLPGFRRTQQLRPADPRARAMSPDYSGPSASHCP